MADETDEGRPHPPQRLTAHAAGVVRWEKTSEGGSRPATAVPVLHALAARRGCHLVWRASMALRMLSSLRMQAVSATFFALPAAHSRS